MKIINKTEHPLLKREQVIAEVEHTGEKTPKMDDLLEKLASTINAKKEMIKIKIAETEFGNAKSTIIANVYKDEKAMKSIEEMRKKKKGVKDAKEEGKE